MSDDTDVPSEDIRADLPDYPWRAVVIKDGVEHDITRELAVLYDGMTGSLDWGSGFMDREDVEAVGRVADLCGFGADTAEKLAQIEASEAASARMKADYQQYLADHPLTRLESGAMGRRPAEND